VKNEKDSQLTQAEWEASWTAEIQRRQRDLREGKAGARPAEDVLEELRREFSKRQPAR
jgi:hypothetical protein